MDFDDFAPIWGGFASKMKIVSFFDFGTPHIWGVPKSDVNFWNPPYGGSKNLTSIVGTPHMGGSKIKNLV